MKMSSQSQFEGYLNLKRLTRWLATGPARVRNGSFVKVLMGVSTALAFACREARRSSAITCDTMMALSSEFGP